MTIPGSLGFKLSLSSSTLLRLEQDTVFSCTLKKLSGSDVARIFYFRDDNMAGQFFLHFGTIFMQIFSALLLGLVMVLRANTLVIFCAATLWLIARSVIVCYWFPLIYRILGVSENRARESCRRYAYFIILNLAFHGFMFVVVRYYAMECWDTWAYRPFQVNFTGNVRKEKLTRHELRLSKKKNPKNVEDLSLWRRLRREKDIEWGFRVVSDIPVWRLKNSYTFRWEDYSAMDPIRYNRNWNIMGESDLLELVSVGTLNQAEYKRQVNKIEKLRFNSPAFFGHFSNTEIETLEENEKSTEESKPVVVEDVESIKGNKTRTSIDSNAIPPEIIVHTTNSIQSTKEATKIGSEQTIDTAKIKPPPKKKKGKRVTLDIIKEEESLPGDEEHQEENSMPKASGIKRKRTSKGH